MVSLPVYIATAVVVALASIIIIWRRHRQFYDSLVSTSTQLAF